MPKFLENHWTVSNHLISTNEYLFYPYLYFCHHHYTIHPVWLSIRWQVSHHILLTIFYYTSTPVTLWFLLWRKYWYIYCYTSKKCFVPIWSIRLYTIVPNNCLRNRIYLLPYKYHTKYILVWKLFKENIRACKRKLKEMVHLFLVKCWITLTSMLFPRTLNNAK